MTLSVPARNAGILHKVSFGPLVLVAVMALATACSSVKTVAPTASYNPPLTKSVEVSEFNIPIEVTAAELQKQINQQVAAVIYDDPSLDNNGGDNLIVKVTKRQPILVTTAGGVLNFKVPVSLYVKAGWKTTQLGITLSKYEDTNFDMDLAFSTKVTVDPSWSVRTTTASNGYNWVSKPVLKLGGFEIPITGVVEKVIDYQLPMLTKLIDDEVGKNLNLKPMVQQAWNTLSTPIEVSRDLKAWLKIKPKELVMTPLSTKNNNLRFALGLRAETETVIGQAPTKEAPAKVPNLKQVPTVNETFQVSLTSLVTYTMLKELAAAQVVGKTFEEGSRKITVTALDVYGKDNQLVVAVDMIGSLKGKIYLMGKPAYDPATTSLVLRDVDYSLETRNALAKTADWLMHGQFVKMMTPYFKASVADQLNQAKAVIQTHLNKPVAKGVSLKGNLGKLDPDQILVTEQGVQALIRASGSLQVLIDGL